MAEILTDNWHLYPPPHLQSRPSYNKIELTCSVLDLYYVDNKYKR